MKIKVLALATASLLAIAPGTSGTAKPVYGTWGYDATAMDAAVKPGDDFFDYVNGAWAKRTPIAADRTFVGIDSVLNDQIEKDVREVIEDQALFVDKELRRLIDHLIEVSQRQDSYAATALRSTFTDGRHRPRKRCRSRDVRGTQEA